MKKLLLVASLTLASTTAIAAETSALITKWTQSADTTIINHKKGWAPVLTLKGDRGTGLVISQGNKQAAGIVMTSGSAKLTVAPSYVAAGVSGNNLGFSKETAAAVFKLEGAKLDGANGMSIALDAKQKKILWINAEGNVVGTVSAQ
ncbi:hypothetical protein [Pseudoalteromonas pernae]|uniref:hypothetical protein n=1 Tax=Pseudoalteromonas pernae TaxID=3118054 RepID=UPI0032422C45